MGYYSSGQGELRFDPPLPWIAYRSLPASRTGEFGWSDLELIEEVEKVDTEDGRLERRTATGVRWISDEQDKKYSVDSEIAKVAELVRSVPGTRVVGWLVRVGEESDNIERYGVDEDGRSVREKAEIRWSDGTKFVP